MLQAAETADEREKVAALRSFLSRGTDQPVEEGDAKRAARDLESLFMKAVGKAHDHGLPRMVTNGRLITSCTGAYVQVMVDKFFYASVFAKKPMDPASQDKAKVWFLRGLGPFPREFLDANGTTKQLSKRLLRPWFEDDEIREEDGYMGALLTRDERIEAMQNRPIISIDPGEVIVLGMQGMNCNNFIRSIYNSGDGEVELFWSWGLRRGYAQHMMYEKARGRFDYTDPRRGSLARRLKVEGFHKVVDNLRSRIDMACLGSGRPGAPILVVGDWKGSRNSGQTSASLSNRILDALSKHYLIISSAEWGSSSFCLCGGRLLAFKKHESFRGKQCNNDEWSFKGCVREKGGQTYRTAPDPANPWCPTCGYFDPQQQHPGHPPCVVDCSGHRHDHHDQGREGMNSRPAQPGAKGIITSNPERAHLPANAPPPAPRPPHPNPRNSTSLFTGTSSPPCPSPSSGSAPSLDSLAPTTSCRRR